MWNLSFKYSSSWIDQLFFLLLRLSSSSVGVWVSSFFFLCSSLLVGSSSNSSDLSSSSDSSYILLLPSWFFFKFFRSSCFFRFFIFFYGTQVLETLIPCGKNLHASNENLSLKGSSFVTKLEPLGLEMLLSYIVSKPCLLMI